MKLIGVTDYSICSVLCRLHSSYGKNNDVTRIDLASLLPFYYSCRSTRSCAMTL